MASSSKGRENSSSRPQRFNDYINGLQKEFELHSNPTSLASPRSSRFNIFVGGLKGEFELMAMEIESLQKERDEVKSKVDVLVKELRDIRRNPVCERCSKGPRTAPRITTPSRFKPSEPIPPSFSKSVVQPKPSHKPSTPSRVVKPSQQTRHMTVPRRPNSANSSARPSQSKSQTRSQHPPDPIVTHFPQVIPPSPSLSETTPTTIDSRSDAERHSWSITFNDEAEKELEVEVAHVLSHEDAVYSVNFSQDGKYLAAGCCDGNAYIYTVQTGTLTCVLKNLLADYDCITKVCFSPDGIYLAIGALGGCIYLWKIRTRHVRNAFKGHDGAIHSLDFSPNGRTIVSASDDNTVRLWSMRSGATKVLTEDNPLFLDMPHYRSGVFHPDGKYVAASHRDGMVRIWRVCTGQLVRRMKAYSNWVNDIAFMPDGKRLVSGRRDETLGYWIINNPLNTTGFRAATDLHEYDSDAEEHTCPGGPPILGGTTVLSVAVLPDCRWVVSGMNSSIRIWNTWNAMMQCTLETGVGVDVESIDVSPTSRYFASGDDGGTVTIWRY